MARKLLVEIIGDSSSFERALKNSTKATTGFGSSLGKMAKYAAFAAGAAGIGGLVLGLKASIETANEHAKAMAQTNAGIKSTGAVANVTAKSVTDLSNAIEKKTGIDDLAVQASENMLLTFTNVRNEVGKGNDIFNQATRAVTDMATRMNNGASPSMEQMSKTSILVGKALNDPIKGMGALRRVGVDFTEGQKKTITAMVDAGNTMGAQKVIVKELNKEFGGSAKALGRTLPGQVNILKAHFGDLAQKIGQKLIPALSTVVTWVSKHWPEISRVVETVTSTVGDAIGGIRDHLADLFAAISSAQGFKAKVKVVWENIQQLAQDLADKIGAALGAVNWSLVGQKVVDGIAAGLQATGKIAMAIAGMLSTVVNSVDWAALGIKMGPGLAAAVAAAFVTLSDPGFWAAHWQLALSVAIAVFPAKFATVAVRMGSEMALAIGRLSPVLGEAFLGLIRVSLQVFARIGPLVGRVLTTLEGVVRVAFGRLGKIAVFVFRVLGIQAAINAVIGFASRVWNAVTSLWGRVVGATTNAFHNVVGAIRGAAGRAAGAARGVGAAIIRGLTNSLSTIGNVIWNAAKSVYSVLASVARTAFGKAVAIGAAIVEGVISGLGDLISRVGGAIADKVGGAIDWAKGHVGSTVEQVAAKKLGLPLTQGIVIGIIAGKGTVESAIQQVLQSAIQKLKDSRAGVQQAMQEIISGAVSAASSLGADFGTKATRALGAKLAAEQEAQKAEQDRRAAADREKALADAKAALAELKPTEGEDPAEFQKRVDAATKAVTDAVQAIADAKKQAQIDADQKALEDAQKRDRDNLEKQLAALEKEAGSAKTKAQVAAYQAKLKALLASYGITQESVQAATDWSTAQTLFVAGMGALKKSMDGVVTGLDVIPPLTKALEELRDAIAGKGVGGIGAGAEHAKGGYLGGNGAIPIMAHAGEYIINAAAARKLGVPFLNRLNRYQSGGPVPPGPKGSPTDTPANRAAAAATHDWGIDNIPGSYINDALLGSYGRSAQVEAMERGKTVDGFELRPIGDWGWSTNAILSAKQLSSFPDLVYEEGSTTQVGWQRELARLANVTSAAGLAAQGVGSAGATLLEHLTDGAVHYGEGGSSGASASQVFGGPGAAGGPRVFASGGYIPSFAHGGIMPYTGLAGLHKGETVIPAGAGGTVVHEHRVYLDGKEITSVVRSRLIKDGRWGGPYPSRSSA